MRLALDLGPVENIVDRDIVGDVNLNRPTRGVDFSAAGITAVFGFQQVVDDAVALTTQVTKRHARTANITRIEDEPAEALTIIADTKFEAQARLVVRLLGDEVYGTTRSVATEEGSLRPAQHFNALNVRNFERGC